MRGLLLIICAISAVQGYPKILDEQSTNYKKQVETLLENIKLLQKDMKELVEQGKVIQAGLHDSRNKIFTVINDNPLVLEVKEILEKAENHENIGECQQLLDYKLYWFGVNLRQHLTDDVEQNLKALELTRFIMDSEFEDIKTDLEKNLEQNLELCRKDDIECKITGKYMDKVEEYFKIVDITKERLPNLFNDVLDYLATVEVPKEIKEIQKLVNKCVK